MATYKEEMIQQYRPESLKLSQSRVREILAKLGLTLVPCRRPYGPVQIGTEGFDGREMDRWDLQDIEVGERKVYLQGDGTYLIFDKQDKNATGTYVPIMQAWPILVEKGYRLYASYQTVDEYAIFPVGNAPKFYKGEGFRCFNGNEMAVWWNGAVENDIITYKPYLPGDSTDSGTDIPEELFEAFLTEVGCPREIKVKLEIPVVAMPKPSWVHAGEWWTREEELPLPEARERAQEFLAQMVKAGLFPADAVVVSSADLKAVDKQLKRVLKALNAKK